MAKTTLDDLLIHDLNGEEETLPQIQNKRKEYPRSAGPGTPGPQETVLLYKNIGNIFKSVTKLNLGQRNPDFIHGDSFQVYYSHPNYRDNPYISSYPPIIKKIKDILWACSMTNQQPSEEDSPERNARFNNYSTPNRIEVIKLYKDVTVTVPKKRKSAIFLLEGDVWVLSSKNASAEQMLYISDIRHGEQGLWLKALRERDMFPRRLLGENIGILTGNVLRSTIVPEKDSSIVVIDYA
jgi:hypothetical protein